MSDLYSILNFICFFCAPVFALCIMKKFLTPRPGLFFTFTRYIMVAISIGTIIFIGDPVNILYILPPYLLTIWLLYTDSHFAKASLALVLFTLTMSMNAIFDSLFNNVLRNILRMVFWFALWLLIRRTMPKQRYTLTPPLWLLTVALAVMPFAAVLSAVTLSEMEKRIALIRSPLALILMPFSFFSALGLLFAIVVLAKQAQLEHERTLWQMRNLYYENLEQEQMQVRRLRHDMANHLQTMTGLDEPMLRVYLDELLASPAMNTARRFCENEIVNTVLCSKSVQIEDAGIQADIQAAVPASLPIAATDLCAVIANALDNAIEACCKMPADKRSLTLRARADKGLLMLHVCNDAPPAPPEMRKFLTTKADTHQHGFGLAGIREITNRYHGSLDLTYEKNTFTLLLTLPIPRSPSVPPFKMCKESGF